MSNKSKIRSKRQSEKIAYFNFYKYLLSMRLEDVFYPASIYFANTLIVALINGNAKS